MTEVSDLKDRLRTDLTASIKARDALRSSTLRMVLTAITNAEVAGKEQRELSDDDVVGGAQHRGEEAPGGGRRRSTTPAATESAAKERAEADGDRRLPARAAVARPRSRDLVTSTIASLGVAGRRHARDGQGDGRAAAAGEGSRGRRRRRRRGATPARLSSGRGAAQPPGRDPLPLPLAALAVARCRRRRCHRRRRRRLRGDVRRAVGDVDRHGAAGGALGARSRAEVGDGARGVAAVDLGPTTGLKPALRSAVGRGVGALAVERRHDHELALRWRRVGRREVGRRAGSPGSPSSRRPTSGRRGRAVRALRCRRRRRSGR